jgi:SAM-dependent methyltransferase
MDIDPRGLEAGGVCGSAEQLPFRSESLDVVAAFDVLEHCHRPGLALAEMVRVLRPGGLLALSVPAYRWAWTDHDVHNGHVTRYTRRRLVDAVEQSGAQVVRATYMFMGTFPFFAADRLRTRLKESRRDIGTPPGEMSDVLTLPEVSPLTEKVLLGASQVDRTLLGKVDLPFGSSVVCAARKSS